jgi:hypothetical protein
VKLDVFDNMKPKNVFVCLLVNLLLVSNVAFSQSTSRQTIWKASDKSLSDLLNDEWKLVSQSISRAATAGTPGVAKIDSTVISYTLMKNNKYITCIIYDPRSMQSTYSGCFFIN